MKFIFFLTLTITLHLTAKAQSYEDRYDECSKPLRALGANIDSLYFVRLGERDSCLAAAPAPNFTSTSVDGQQIELAKLKGQVVVLNFWFTRCQPCIEEMPDLNKLVNHYSDKEVKFISLAPEEASVLKTFFVKHPFNFTAIASSENIRIEKFRLFSAWPYSIIIDREGKISKMWFSNPGGDVFNFYRNFIDKLL